jgi:PAS domain S-box-containing protein
VTESDFQTFEAVGALVVVLDVDARIVYWNHCCSDLTGYSLEEVRGRRLWDFALIPEEVEAVMAAFAALLTSRCPVTSANYWMTKTGEQRWIAFSHTLTTDPDGRVQYVVETGIDRSESKRASDDLRASEASLNARVAESSRLYEAARQATDDLREANQHMVSATIRAQELTEKVEAALTRAEASERELRATAEFRELFIGVLGHDLRNPLGSIRMAVGMQLQRGHLDEHDRKAATLIVRGVDRMMRMIQQLLDLTRARLGGGFPIEPKASDLRDICGSVAEEFGTHIHLELEGDLTGTWDPDRLAEALSNIVGNAVEHALPGTPVVVWAYPDGAQVVVEITNRGQPIPADLLPFIFEPFHRGKSERSATGNLGLGLYIAKQIVLADGGTLEACSIDGETTFTMRLPWHAPSPSPPLSQSQPEARG